MSSNCGHAAVGQTKDDSAITKTVNITLLLDIYGSLLSSRQRDCLSLFYEEDLSLAEIGEKFSISRQAAHDAIRHGENQLHSYEEALGLVAKNKERQKIIGQLKMLTKGNEQAEELLNALI